MKNVIQFVVFAKYSWFSLQQQVKFLFCGKTVSYCTLIDTFSDRGFTDGSIYTFSQKSL